MSDFKVVQPPTGSEVVLLPLSSALWGATCVQTFIYFMHFADKDPLATRLMVISLWIADTAHIVLAIVGVYSFEITHWGDLQYVESVTNQPFLWSLFFTALVACTVQLFFTYRIWKMRPGNPVSYILPLLAISQPALYTAFLVICYGTLTKSKLLAVVNLLLAEWAISAATDVLIAASLLYLIWSIKSESSDNNGGMIRSTGRILQRLVILTVNTGVWTAICSLFSIITATAFKATPAFTAVAFLICPLYCNTLLANLNMRETIRGDSYSVPVSKMTFAERLGGLAASQSSTRVLEQNGSAEMMKTVNKSEDSVMAAKNA